MPKVSVYLSDDLYRQVQEKGLSLSALTQRAVERALQESSTEDWIGRVRERGSRVRGTVNTGELLEQVRNEFGA